MAKGIGARIRDAREAKPIPMRQATLAAKIGISRQSMSAIERGRQRLTSELLADVIVALELQGDDVLKLLGLRVETGTVIKRDTNCEDAIRCRGVGPVGTAIPTPVNLLC